MSEESKLAGPDFSHGVPLTDIAEGGMLLGHAAGEPVLLARSGREVFAIGAECTHYHGPLAEGLRIGDTVRCPWHHACFNLRTGEALHAPALDPVACWRVEQRNGMIFVHDKLAPARGAARTATRGQPESVVIIGGGAAGQAAAEMLRREGYIGPVTMLSAETSGPMTDRICQRIISPATHPRNGCRCARPNFTPNTRSCSPSARAQWPSMPRPAKYSSPTAPGILGVRCCSPPAPSRSASVSPGPSSRMSTPCAAPTIAAH